MGTTSRLRHIIRSGHSAYASHIFYDKPPENPAFDGFAMISAKCEKRRTLTSAAAFAGTLFEFLNPRAVFPAEELLADVIVKEYVQGGGHTVS